MKTRTLERSSERPLYRQLAMLLEKQIRSGVLPPGAKLRSENTLVRDFRVSRYVVRRALTEIANAGLINSHHGRGSFVNQEKIAKPVSTLTSYRSSMMAYGLTPDVKTLTNEVVPATASLAQQLHVSERTPLARIERLAFVHGEPFTLLEALLPLSYFPALLDVDFDDRSLYATIEELYGTRMTRSESFIEAATASEREAELLGIKPGALLLVLEGVGFDQNDRPVEYCRVVNRNDRMKFYVESFAKDIDKPGSSTSSDQNNQKVG